MIKLILKGGLGNQMFQYALGKSLALEYNTNLYLDLSFLKNRLPIKNFTPRNYELDLFEIKEKTGTLLKNALLDKYISYPIELILNKTLNKSKYITEGENPYLYKPEVFKLDGSKNITIEGYWNNYKYFQKHENIIKQIFDTEKLIDGKYIKIEREIMQSSSVSINIRRGDYTNAKHSEIFTFLDTNYYKKAIETIRSKVENPHFYVFSYDDPQWFEKTFNMKKNEYTIMGREYVGDRFKTYLRLVSLCKHNIISNSTFAWWGAYLNKNKNKIVISPKRWMVKYDFDNIPKWIEI